MGLVGEERVGLAGEEGAGLVGEERVALVGEEGVGLVGGGEERAEKLERPNRKRRSLT